MQDTIHDQPTAPLAHAPEDARDGLLKAGHEKAAPPLKDPVCGMTVTPQSAHVLQHAGKPVYFCSGGCKAKFAVDPDKYLPVTSGATLPATPRAEPVLTGVIYTCAMHPEIRWDHPGLCPKCGMALEPETPTLDEEGRQGFM